MFYHSAEVDEDLQCSFCKEKFTDVIKLVPSCGESICGECYDELQTGLDSTREFTCQACKDTHVMPLDGLTDNRGLCRLIKKRKIEKPISDQAKILKEELSSLKDNLTTLKSFDPREHINLHCDNLEAQVNEAFESAISQLQKLQNETLTQIRDYRSKQLDSWAPRAQAGLNTNEERQPFGHTQRKLQALDQEIAELTSKWNEYFSNPETLASENSILAALEESNRLDKMLGSLKSSMTSCIFGGKLMTFKPNYASLEDENKLKESFNFELEFESVHVVFQLQSTPVRTLTGHTEEVHQVIPIPAGRFASCSNDKTIKLWNAHDGAELFELQGHADWVTCLAVLPNGFLASGSCDTTIKLWDLSERKEVRTLKGHTRGINSLVALKNGNLASYSADDTIRIWNPYRTADNLLMTMTGHGNQDWITPFSVLSNDYLVTCTNDAEQKEDCIMRVWNPSIGQMVKAVPTGHVDVWSILALSNDQVALGVDNGTIKLIDWTDDAKSRTKEKAHHSQIFSFTQLSDGNLLSVGKDSSPDGRCIKMWNLDDFSLLQTIATGHSDSFVSICLSPDDTLLASASGDSTIKLWSIISTSSKRVQPSLTSSI